MFEESVEALVKRFFPKKLKSAAKKAWRKRKKALAESLEPLSEERFRQVLVEDLRLVTGDVVFVHAGVEALNLDFPFFKILPMLREVIGEEGTLMFPTYPKWSCFRYLSEDSVFDVRKSPSYTGILSEFARRQKKAVRSFHPTKSVVSIGPHAEALSDTHSESPRPYDACSPYHKMMSYGGKIIGLGAELRYLSFVHCVDDALADRHPVFPYHREIFHARCIDHDGSERIVDSYAHDLAKLDGRPLMQFLRKHVPADICEAKIVQGMPFFRADTVPLFELMCTKALEGHTTFPKSAYEPDWQTRVAAAD